MEVELIALLLLVAPTDPSQNWDPTTSLSAYQRGFSA